MFHNLGSRHALRAFTSNINGFHPITAGIAGACIPGSKRIAIGSSLPAIAPLASADSTFTGQIRAARVGRGIRLALIFAAIALAMFLVLDAGGAEPAPVPPVRKQAPAPRRGRETKVIDDGWTFCADPSNTGEANGWTKTPPPGTQPIVVPSLWPTGTSPGAATTAWYFREIDPPGSWLGQTIRLRFEAVADQARVWLNGERIGEHSGGATPFEFNITKTVKAGAKNLLAVRVEGNAGRGAGMWQGVLLMAHDEAYISDVFPYGGPLGNLRAEIELTNTSDKSGDSALDARVLEAGGTKKDIKSSGQILSLTPKRNVTTMLVNVSKKRLAPWSPDNPSLYYLELVFHQDKDVLDTTETTFGFREFGWKDGAITINGIALKPKAVSPGLARPVVIASEQDSNAARSLLKKLKAAAVNVVYLEAPPPAMLGLADEVGLLVIEGPRRGLSAAERESELLSLVLRDRAHPSILAWNVNGLGDTVAANVRKLDVTRFTLQKTGAESKLVPPRSDDQQPVAIPTGLLPP